MYTQVEVDVELLNQAKKVLNVADDASAVEQALLKVVSNSDKAILASYFGKLDLDVDMDALRGRNRVSWRDEE